MFKLTIGLNGYSLSEYNLSTGKYNKLVKDSSIDTIIQYNKKFLSSVIKQQELDMALKDMSDSMYNTAEFGTNGYYTVPYYDENVI